MPATAQKNAPAYLREARLAAGFVNRGTAAATVPFSPETIGRHERGDVIMEPTDAVIYARCYKNPAIMYRYCSECPIGQQIGRTATERTLSDATLRVHHLITAGQAVVSRLEEIAFDGRVDSSELDFFGKALDYFRNLEDSITDFILVGLEKGKGAPAPTGTPSTENN